MTWIARISCAAMLAAGAASAQTVPAGWQVVKDNKNLCQLAVPADWTPDKLAKSFVTAADKKANAVIHALAPNANYAQSMATAKQLMIPVKMFEDTAQRTWFSVARGNGKPGSSWYVATGGSQICTAQIDFDDPAFEATAKKIVDSIGKAR
jgi:cytoskeletal protein RodZ